MEGRVNFPTTIIDQEPWGQQQQQLEWNGMEWNVLSRARPNQRTTKPRLYFPWRESEENLWEQKQFYRRRILSTKKNKIPTPPKSKKTNQKKATSYKSAKLLPRAWIVTRIQDRFWVEGGSLEQIHTACARR